MRKVSNFGKNDVTDEKAVISHEKRWGGGGGGGGGEGVYAFVVNIVNILFSMTQYYYKHFRTFWKFIQLFSFTLKSLLCRWLYVF